MFNSTIFGRQPIVNKQQQLIGYQFLPAGEQLNYNTTQSFLNNFCEEDTWTLGEQFVFTSPVVGPLNEKVVGSLPPEHRAVVSLSSNVVTDDALRTALSEIKAQGGSICLHDFLSGAPSTALLDLSDFVILDGSRIPVNEFALLAKQLDSHPLRKIAKIEDRQQVEAYAKAGADAFYGFYFVAPVNFNAKGITPNFANIVTLMKMAQNNADLQKIDDALKRDVALSFKLLRYINSAGFGLSCEIHSFRHAVTILGYQKLYRWLSLLLVTAGKDSTPQALMKTAITRGRIIELLGSQCFEAQDRDNLFIVGVFSLLETMLEMRMDKILEQLNLPENVCDALTQHQGIYGPFLELTQALENPDLSRANELASNLQLSAEKINKAQLSALAWVEKLGI